MPSRGDDIRRGDLFWVEADESLGSVPGFAHPHVVVQDDVLNRSRISTVVVCALTSNLKRANEPGNVLLEPGEGDLDKQSVVLVSQVSAVDKQRLGGFIGALSQERVDEILAGLRFQQVSFFNRPVSRQIARMPATAGYSGTPLARKLGLQAGSRVWLFEAPDGFVSLLEPIPEDVVFERAAGPRTDIAHIFVTQREDLVEQLGRLRPLLNPEVILWVSWPKKASKRPTTVTEDTIREVALPLGFVDVKVCAVDEVWSGLKLVVRKALR